MSERLYALLLQLYPRAFRDRYAAEMASVFRDRLRHETAWRVWLDVIGDAVVSIARQHWVGEPHPVFPPSAAPVRDVYAKVGQGLIVSGAFGAVLGFLGIAVWSSDIRLAATRVPGGWPLAGSSFLLLSWAAFYMGRRAYRSTLVLKGYRADVVGDSITVTLADSVPLTLQRSDVIGVLDFSHVGLRIQTADPARDLWVPFRTDSYAGVKARLSQWAPVTTTSYAATRHPAGLVLYAVVYSLAVFAPLALAGPVVCALTVSEFRSILKPSTSRVRTLAWMGLQALFLARMIRLIAAG